MDYKQLLERYIAHVDMCEGTTFIAPHDRADSERWGNIQFTDEEWAELEKLDRSN